VDSTRTWASWNPISFTMALDIGSIVGEYAQGLRLFPMGSCYEICVYLKEKSKAGNYFHETVADELLFGTITSISDGLLQFKIDQSGLPTGFHCLDEGNVPDNPARFAVPTSQLDFMVGALGWNAKPFWMQFKLISACGHEMKLMKWTGDLKAFVASCSAIQAIPPNT